MAMAAAGVSFHNMFGSVESELEDLRAMGGDTGSEYGLAIMGMGWSEDGRRLYVGTEKGIFEFELVAERRRQFPAVKPR